MKATFITFADSIYSIQKSFPEATFTNLDRDKINVTIEINDDYDVSKLFLAGVEYGADRMLAHRISGQLQ